MKTTAFKVSVLIITLCVGFGSCIQDCQEQRVKFTAEPSDIKLDLTAHTVAQFSCQYKGGSLRATKTKLEWIINSKIYSLSKLPPNHMVHENGNLLYVTNITSNDNDTTYQCQIVASGVDKQYQCAFRSKIGRLLINGNDSVESFIKITFNKATSSINCTFINQLRKSEKYCLVKYCSTILRCRMLSQVKAYVSNSNSISLHLNVENTTTIWYNAEAGNGTKFVRVGGSITLVSSAGRGSTPASISVIIFLLIVMIIMIMAAIIIMIYYIRLPKKSFASLKDNIFTGSSTLQLCDELSFELPVDRETSYYTTHIVTEDNCLMYKFTTEFYPDHQPQDGFGYYKLTNEEIMHISPYERVIIMDENNPLLPKLITTGSNLRKLNLTTPQKSLHVYAQDRTFTKILNLGSKILCYFSSEVVIAYTKIFDVTESCKYSHLLTPQHKPEWNRYGYFEFTKPEHIRPDQRVIVMKHDGTLVTGPGIRYILGITGNGSTITMPTPSDLVESDDEQHDNSKPESGVKHDVVFIQNRERDRILEPGTKYLFCVMMVKLYEYYAIYDVSESSNMADFGSLCIPGFKTERGYGYYEYREPEFIKPHKNVILMDKKGRLFTGPGARFFYTGCEYDMDAVLRKKRVSPPNLDGTQWAQIFVQSHSKTRILKQGTKFLYCEHKSTV